MDKMCDKCMQSMPVSSFEAEAKMSLGYANTCLDCNRIKERGLHVGQIDRYVVRHNKKILTAAWPKMPHSGIGYDIGQKVNITWELELFRYDLYIRVYDSKGQILARCYNGDLAVADKIRYVSKFLAEAGIRLEPDTYTRELTRRVIYIY